MSTITITIPNQTPVVKIFPIVSQPGSTTVDIARMDANKILFFIAKNICVLGPNKNDYKRSLGPLT